MYKVYKISTTESDGFYIGMTQQPLTKRFSQHKTSALRGKEGILYSAMRKYSRSSFKIELLKEYDTREECCDSEIHYIKKLHPRYNITKGGDGGWAVPDEKKEEWKNKLKIARKGRKPSLGMKHTPENKKLFLALAKKYYEENGYKPEEILKLSFKEANKQFGISKTHYYRLKKRAQTNDLC